MPDSYEHLLLDIIDGDNHLFMRSDELGAAWNILSPVLQEMDKKNIAPELYELGGRGPVGTFYLRAKHGVGGSMTSESPYPSLVPFPENLHFQKADYLETVSLIIFLSGLFSSVVVLVDTPSHELNNQNPSFKY